MPTDSIYRVKIDLHGRTILLPCECDQILLRSRKYLVCDDCQSKIWNNSIELFQRVTNENNKVFLIILFNYCIGFFVIIITNKYHCTIPAFKVEEYKAPYSMNRVILHCFVPLNI